MIAYYVQVRYPRDRRWVTIDVCEGRTGAAMLAGEAFRHLTDCHGNGATQVRVITGPDLVREGGRDAVNHAAHDLSDRHTPVVAEGG